MKTTPEKLQPDFQRSSDYIDKAVKAIIKIRKTQLSFTMSDTQLSEQIDTIPDEDLD